MAILTDDLWWFRQQLNVTFAVFTHDFVADVLHSCSEFVFAMRTLRVKRFDDHQGRVGKRNIAVFTLYFHVSIFCMNTQFFIAARTFNIMAFRGRSSNHGQLRQGHKLRNLDTIFGQLRIQQRATGPTMNNARRHMVAALGTRTSWPRTIHRNSLAQNIFVKGRYDC